MKQETKTYIKELYEKHRMKSVASIVSLIFLKDMEKMKYGILYAKVFKELQRLK